MLSAVVQEKDKMPAAYGHNVFMETEVELIVAQELETDACDKEVNSSRPCGIQLALNATEHYFSKNSRSHTVLQIHQDMIKLYLT